jgi:hypothetical protein
MWMRFATVSREAIFSIMRKDEMADTYINLQMGKYFAICIWQIQSKLIYRLVTYFCKLQVQSSFYWMAKLIQIKWISSANLTFLIIEEMASLEQHLEKFTFFHYFCLHWSLASSCTKMEGYKEDLRSQMFLHFYFATRGKQDWKGFYFSWLRNKVTNCKCFQTNNSYNV